MGALLLCLCMLLCPARAGHELELVTAWARRCGPSLWGQRGWRATEHYAGQPRSGTQACAQRINTLLLLLDGDTFSSGANPIGALLESVGVSNNQVRITLSSRAMSHVMRRPSASVLDIEILPLTHRSNLPPAGMLNTSSRGHRTAPGAAERASSLGDSLPIDAGKDFLHTALKMLDNAQQNVLSLSPSDLLDTAKNRLTGLLPLSVFFCR